MSRITINPAIFKLFTSLTLGLWFRGKGQMILVLTAGRRRGTYSMTKIITLINLFGSQTLEETAAQLTANVSYIHPQAQVREWRCMVMSSVGEPRTEGL
jgi:hypothetical protein